MKQKIHWQLTLLRDKRWMPDFMVEIIDWFRYELFYTYEEGGENMSKQGNSKLTQRSVTGSENLTFVLSPRQLELIGIHRKAFGKVYLIVKNGRAKLVNPDDLVILE